VENNKNNIKSENLDSNIHFKNNEFQDEKDNLVKDLRETLQITVKETLENLDELLKTIEGTLDEESTYKETKEFVQQINSKVSDTIKNQVNRIPEKINQKSQSLLLDQEEE
tara:strand:- start:63 stop:395 length:333 start_codon:yes stop_codon:yes gene_type:complete